MKKREKEKGKTEKMETERRLKDKREQKLERKKKGWRELPTNSHRQVKGLQVIFLFCLLSLGLVLTVSTTSVGFLIDQGASEARLAACSGQGCAEPSQPLLG